MQKPTTPAPRAIDPHLVRRAHERGARETEWLRARFSFSFGDYQDPNHMHWGALRALNEDWVAPGGGFARHGHRDIEALTIPLEGAIHHTDDLGHDFVFGPGQLLHMAAGTGITHTEVNASATEPERHLQIWFYPRKRGTPPRCELLDIRAARQGHDWRVIASPDGRDGSASIGQNALLMVGRVRGEEPLRYALDEHRLGYLHVVSGEIEVEPKLRLRAGDGLRFTHRETLALRAVLPDPEVLLFDL